MSDIAVITCFFNFKNYSAPKRNLRRWQRQMEAQGAPVFGVELILHGRDAITTGWEGWQQIRVLEGLHMVWQKEAALNTCAKNLPDQFTKVVVCDCDVFFDNPHWLAQTSAVLDVVNACSPFETAQWTDAEGDVELERPSIGKDPSGLIPAWRSHPGFAIALTRDFWHKDGPNGIYPFYVIGNGDSALGAALCNVDPTTIHVDMFKVGVMLPTYMDWFNRVRKWSTGLAYVRGDCVHEYHGKPENRYYYERLQWIKNLNPSLHLKFNNQGLLEWTPAAPRDMVENVAHYFTMRKEDDAVPEATDIAVVTCHFNFAGYKAGRSNLVRFSRHMKACHVALYGVEAYLKGTEPFTKGWDNWKQIEVEQDGILWQKEALLNEAARSLPSRFTKVIWADADISYADPQWAVKTSRLLDTYQVVQPFNRCHWVNQDGSLRRSAESVFKAPLDDRSLGHPGFVMAARREFFTKLGGLYTKMAGGSGDSLFAAALVHKDLPKWLNFLGCGHHATQAEQLAWCKKLKAWVGDSYTYVDADLWHDWHGDVGGRAYPDRRHVMQGFDSTKEVRLLPNRTLAWTEQANEDRRNYLVHHFNTRDEDGNGNGQSGTAPLSIASAVTVTDMHTAQEAQLAILSLRHLHPDTKVYVVCDDAAAAWFKQKNMKGVEVVNRGLFTEPADIPHRWKSYHNLSAVYQRFFGLTYALERHANALYFDADFAFLAPLTATAGKHDAVLSYSQSVHAKPEEMGMFNAGLIWVNHKDFVSWWEKRWLNPPTQQRELYEQTALNDAAKHFKVGYFPHSHNWGHWRQPVTLGHEMLSAHVHLFAHIETPNWPGGQQRFKEHRDACIEYIARKHPTVARWIGLIQAGKV